MFWRFGFHTQSPIDTLLEKEEVTLEEILEEEELIQECKTPHRKLVEFLARPEVLEALLAYIKDPAAEDVDETMKYKYACLAAEIFGCEVMIICDSLIQNQPLLEDFWKFLDQPAPLNPIQSSYFVRVFIALINKKTEEAIKFFKEQKNVLDRLIYHLETSAFIDLVLKLVAAEETREGEGILQWLLDQNLISRLVSLFSADLSAELHSNASQLLTDILNLVQLFGTKNPVIHQLKSTEIQEAMMKALCDSTGPNLESGVSSALSVEVELIQRSLGFVQEGEMQVIDFKEEDLSDFMVVLAPRLGFFHDLMLKSRPDGVTQSIEEASPENPLPLGSLRLKIIEFFIIVLHVNHPVTNKKILELNIVPCYIDLFFKYQWNNFLHSLVHDLIVRIFNADLEFGEQYIQNTLKEGDLLNRIVRAARDNEIEIEERRGLRRGYMGHLVLISNHLWKYSELPEVSEEVHEFFDSEDWRDFSSVILSEANQRDNKPLGGHRPSIAGDHNDLFHSVIHDDTSADQFGDDDDDDIEIDDEIIEKPGLHGGYGHPFYDDDDSDDELESPQHENFASFPGGDEYRQVFE